MRQGFGATARRRDLRDLEGGMATVGIEARPGSGVFGYSLFVDGLPATMDSVHRGEAACAGRCGDGSSHTLLYSFNGAPGSRLGITLRCAGQIVCRLADLRIGDSGPPWQAGRIMFVI